MELPTVPTDNLYKFMALSGLAIVITCLYLFFSRADALNERFYAVTQRKAMADSKFNHLQMQINTNRDKTLEVRANIKEGLALSVYEDLLAENKRLSEDGERIKNELSSYSTEAIEVATAQIINNEILSLQKRQAVALMICGVFGVTISCCGFGLWYSRVQKFLDTQLASANNVTS